MMIKQWMVLGLGLVLLTSCTLKNGPKRPSTGGNSAPVVSQDPKVQESASRYGVEIPRDLKPSAYIGNPWMIHEKGRIQNFRLHFFFPSQRVIPPDVKGEVTLGRGAPELFNVYEITEQEVVSLPVFLCTQNIPWEQWEERLAKIKRYEDTGKTSWLKDLRLLEHELERYQQKLDAFNSFWSEPWHLYGGSIGINDRTIRDQDVQELSINFEGRKDLFPLTHIHQTQGNPLNGGVRHALIPETVFLWHDFRMPGNRNDLQTYPKIPQTLTAKEDVEITGVTFSPQEFQVMKMQGELVDAQGKTLWTKDWAPKSRWRIPKGTKLHLVYEAKNAQPINEVITQLALETRLHYQIEEREFICSWGAQAYCCFSAKDLALMQKYHLDPWRAIKFCRDLEEVWDKKPQESES